MIMIMGMMTYAKFNSYRIEAALQKQFENTIQYKEREYFNSRSIEKYNNKHLQTKKSEKKEEKNKKNNSSKKIPIGVLLEKSQQSIGTGRYESTRALLKALIYNVYGKEKVLSEALKNRPDAIDEIINRLPEAVQKLPGNQKITGAKGLANLDLEDDTLNSLLYKLLKGTHFLYERKGEVVSEGYPPLTDFINSDKGKKIRVYLARKEIIDALFNPNISDEIVATRESLFLELSGGRIEANQATERFKTLFEGALAPYASHDMVDFAVSKTDPKRSK